jgi:catechol 2,3-dioxygenase-like lactoylglutathione lyase family enzyme
MKHVRVETFLIGIYFRIGSRAGAATKVALRTCESITMIKRIRLWLGLFIIIIIPAVWLSSRGRLYGAAGSETAIRRPPIVGVANISLRVSNLTRSRQFYSGGLGFELAFTTVGPGGLKTSYFKVNDHQFIELAPNLRPDEDRLIHIGLETTDVRTLRSYLADQGVHVPASVRRLPDGTLGFEVTDPDGHRMQFVQYVPGSEEAEIFGKFISPRRLSKHILHAGISVQNQARADAFYHNILGLHDFWNVWAAHGCCIDMRLPNGTDWVEYMMHPRPLPPARLGSAHHFCLGVPSVARAYKEALARGLKPAGRIKQPRIGRDGKRQFNLRDPDGTRVEIMEFKPVRPPSPPFTP